MIGSLDPDERVLDPYTEKKKLVDEILAFEKVEDACKLLNGTYFTSLTVDHKGNTARRIVITYEDPSDN